MTIGLQQGPSPYPFRVYNSKFTRLAMTITQQESTAVSVLYGEYAPFLRNVIRRKFRVPADDVEGIVQDIFEGYLRSHDRVQDPKRWLLGAACNASRYYWRQHRPEEQLPKSIGRCEAEKLQALLTVNSVLRRLGAECRELLEEHYLAGFSASEIASRRSTTTGYAQQLLHKCLKTARGFVKKDAM